MTAHSTEDLLSKQSSARFGAYGGRVVTRKDSISSFLSGATAQEDMTLTYKDAVKEQFGDAIACLTDAREKLQNQLAKARSCIIQAELILFTVADVDEIQSD